MSFEAEKTRLIAELEDFQAQLRVRYGLALRPDPPIEGSTEPKPFAARRMTPTAD